jgi:hypothetical protein
MIVVEVGVKTECKIYGLLDYKTTQYFWSQSLI